ncbi:hypothetical protein HDV03_000382 [Kappamyces sp. JEL0829]|nr:hypothetical protein HDV03_000382 [Kappamyces sp. JEL0829]
MSLVRQNSVLSTSRNLGSNRKLASMSLDGLSVSGLTQKRAEATSEIELPNLAVAIPPPGPVSVLNRIREEKQIRKAPISSGPRLGPDTVVNKESIYAQGRQKAKELSERLRAEIKEQPAKPEPTKKKPLLTKTRSAAEIRLPRSLDPLKEAQKAVKKDLTLFSKLDADSALSGDIENPEALLHLMPERKRAESDNNISEAKNSSVLMYSPRKVKRDREGIHVNTPVLPVTVASSDTNLKYGRLMSSVKIPSLGCLVLNKRQSLNSEIPSSPTPPPVEPREGEFWLDFDILLDRQEALEQTFLSVMSSTEDNVSHSQLVRFPRCDVVNLIWNMFVHLRKDTTVKLFGLELTKSIYEIARSETQDSKAAHELKNLFKTVDRPELLEIKAMIGHLKRIALISAENKVGIRQLIKASANLLANLMFTNIPTDVESYVSPTLDLGVSTILFDILPQSDDVRFLEVSTNSSPRPSSPFEGHILLNPVSETVSKSPSHVNFEPPMLSNLLKPESIATMASQQPVEKRPRSKARSALVRVTTKLVLETEEEMNERRMQMKIEDVELFDYELPLNWNARAVDILVRFWDFVLSK